MQVSMWGPFFPSEELPKTFLALTCTSNKLISFSVLEKLLHLHAFVLFYFVFLFIFHAIHAFLNTHHQAHNLPNSPPFQNPQFVSQRAQLNCNLFLNN